MADENTIATEGNEARTEAQESSGQASDTHGKLTDLSAVDPVKLQAEIDRHVQRAIKTREENLAKKTAAEKAEQERRAAEDRGEYEKVKAELQEQLETQKKDLLVTKVSYSLRDVARDAGLIDMDDIKLIEADAVAAAVDESGSIDTDKLREVVESFRAHKPHKFKSAEAQQGSRFGGAPTSPPNPGAPKAQDINDPNYYRNAGLDDYYRARQTQLQRLKTPKRSGHLEAIAELLAGKVKP